MYRKLTLMLAVLLLFCALPAALAENAAEETIVEDFERGYWLYEADGVRIEINRMEDTSLPLVWYEADLQFSEQVPINFFLANPERPGKEFRYGERIARDNRLVFAINDDQCGHRIYNHERVGVVIRGGEVISDTTLKSGNHMLPNLDTCAFLPDGTIQVFQSKEHTAEEYLAMGAKDVLSFGPYILRDGVMNPLFEKYYRYEEARSCIGMLEPYHYVCMVVEGGFKRSPGIALEWVANKLLEKGVKQAFNLDGGHTSSIIFMGKKLEISNPTGVVKKARSLSGVIGLGTSDKVPAYEGVGK